MYTFRLLFRDATGLIDGLVFAEDGQTFFNVRVDPLRHNAASFFRFSAVGMWLMKMIVKDSVRIDTSNLCFLCRASLPRTCKQGQG